MNELIKELLKKEIYTKSKNLIELNKLNLTRHNTKNK